MDFLDAGSTDNSVIKNQSSYCVSYKIKKMQQVAFDKFLFVKARKRCPVTAPVKIRYKPRRKKRKPKCCRLKKKSKLMVQKCYKKNGKIYREEEYI